MTNTADQSQSEATPRGVIQLRRLLTLLPSRLATIGADIAGHKPSPTAWSPKQELGHLIDSAANNHQRVARAQFEDGLHLPEYDGDRWVDLHGYQNREWPELIEFWRFGNTQLLSAAESVPHQAWSHTLTIGGSKPVTLRFVIDDYIDHMSSHLKHIGVEISDLSESDDTIYPEKPAETEYPVNELLRRRWSSRLFETDRAVNHKTVMSLLEAARWAPSCFNDQPRFFLVFDGSDAEALKEAQACLAPGNAWALSAPILIFSVARETFERNGKPNRWGQHDTGAAMENLLLQATDLGLRAHAMGGFDAERVCASFGVPEGYTPMAAIAVGYPHRGSLENLDEKQRVKELAPRQRKPLSQMAFNGMWGRELQ
jgi:nitroreductase